MLWATIGKKLGWERPRNKKISKLFRKDEATGAILQFLKDDVGKTKKGALRSPTPDWGDDGGPVTSEKERMGREYLESLVNSLRVEKVLWRISLVCLGDEDRGGRSGAVEVLEAPDRKKDGKQEGMVLS